MEYMLELRKLVGHRPLVMVGTATFIIDSGNRLLMLKRSDNGLWGPPGGALEPGELLEASAAREVLEETGLELNELALFGVFSGPEMYYRYPNDDEIFGVSIVYLARRWRGEVCLNDEHTEWHWFPTSEIPEDLSPPIIPAIKKFLSGNLSP
jgi:ADP-ribose pyrophosphatase YjhB (NUDIX family)